MVSCYEAGRDGFWLHRWLLGLKACRTWWWIRRASRSNRRQRRAKSDRLDVEKLLQHAAPAMPAAK